MAVKKISLLHNIICMFILISFFSCSNDKKRNQATTVEKYISKEIQKLEKENINQSISNQMIFFGNDSTKKFALKDFILEKRIFFWFSQNTCSPCIDRCVDIIKAVFPSFENNENIVFVSPDYPARFRENCYNKRLLTLQDKFFGLELEKIEVPFFFILNSNLEIESIHLVNKNDFTRTEKYLQEIKTLIGRPHK